MRCKGHNCIFYLLTSQLQGLSYDLGDAAVWEFFFPNIDKPMLVIPGEDFNFRLEDSEDTKVCRW